MIRSKYWLTISDNIYQILIALTSPDEGGMNPIELFSKLDYFNELNQNLHWNESEKINKWKMEDLEDNPEGEISENEEEVARLFQERESSSESESDEEAEVQIKQYNLVYN